MTMKDNTIMFTMTFVGATCFRWLTRGETITLCSRGVVVKQIIIVCELLLAIFH